MSEEPEQELQPESRPNLDLERRQIALVASLTGGGPVPQGFDPHLIGIAARALLRKRADGVARQWPLLAAEAGPSWPRVFTDWAADRPTGGSFRDGWDLAVALEAAGTLGELGRNELAAVRRRWHYDGNDVPRPRIRTLQRIRRRIRLPRGRT